MKKTEDTRKLEALIKEKSTEIGRVIADYKRLEEALEKGETRFRNFLETSNDLMYIADKDGNFTYTNASMARALGYSREEMKGMNISAILSVEARTLLEPRIAELVARGEITLEPAWMTKDGMALSGELKIVANYDFEGGFIGTQGVMRNATACVQTQVFDKEALMARFGGNGAFLREIAEAFLKIVPPQVEILKKALEVNDAEAVRMVADQIKGASDNVAAVAIHDLVTEIEAAAGTADLGRASLLAEQVDGELDAFRSALNASGLTGE